MSRRCDWCDGPIDDRARRDAVTCSQSCRQARHRFHRAVGRGVAHGRPLRLGYADPPYPGKARLYPEGVEVDHAELICRLSSDFDGWALSTSAAALPMVLSCCPRGVRVAAWHRGERPNAQARGPQSAWEPVIFHGGRARVARGSARRVDSLVYVARPRLTDRRRVIGAKPAAFWPWLFALLGASPADSFDDLFPGSGGGGRAWRVFCGRDVESDASSIAGRQLALPEELWDWRAVGAAAGDA